MHCSKVESKRRAYCLHDIKTDNISIIRGVSRARLSFFGGGEGKFCQLPLDLDALCILIT